MKQLLTIYFSLLFSFSFSQEKVDSSIIELFKLAPTKSEIAFAIIEEDHTEVFGFAKATEGIYSKCNAETIFEIGSITKIFTSMLLSKSIEEKQLKAKTTINKLLGFKLHKNAKLTLLQLSNHTAGLPRLPSNFIEASPFDIKNPYKNYTETLFLHYLQNQLTPMTPPGACFSYSNTGAGLLGYLLSKQQKCTFEQLLQEQIALPLGLKSTTSNDITYEDELIPSYDSIGNLQPFWNFNVLTAAGSVKSNLTDMITFAKAHLQCSPTYLTRMQVPTFTISPQTQIGMGWFIITKDNRTLLFHNGATGGYSSCMILDIQAQKAIIALTNISSTVFSKGELDDFCFDLLE